MKSIGKIILYCGLGILLPAVICCFFDLNEKLLPGNIKDAVWYIGIITIIIGLIINQIMGEEKYINRKKIFQQGEEKEFRDRNEGGSGGLGNYETTDDDRDAIYSQNKYKRFKRRTNYASNRYQQYTS